MRTCLVRCIARDRLIGRVLRNRPAGLAARSHRSWGHVGVGIAILCFLLAKDVRRKIHMVSVGVRIMRARAGEGRAK